jgi:hypothetical protein
MLDKDAKSRIAEVRSRWCAAGEIEGHLPNTCPASPPPGYVLIAPDVLRFLPKHLVVEAARHKRRRLLFGLPGLLQPPQRTLPHRTSARAFPRDYQARSLNNHLPGHP